MTMRGRQVQPMYAVQERRPDFRSSKNSSRPFRTMTNTYRVCFVASTGSQAQREAPAQAQTSGGQGLFTCQTRASKRFPRPFPMTSLYLKSEATWTRPGTRGLRRPSQRADKSQLNHQSNHTARSRSLPDWNSNTSSIQCTSCPLHGLDDENVFESVVSVEVPEL